MLVLLATFLLTVFRDLTEGIGVGVVLGAVLFMHRMAQLVEVQTHSRLIERDEADTVGSNRTAYTGPLDDDVMVYRINGPFFFGAANEVSAVLDRIGQYPREFVLDLSGVPFADTSAAHSLKSFAEKRGVPARRSPSRGRMPACAACSCSTG